MPPIRKRRATWSLAPGLAVLLATAATPAVADAAAEADPPQHEVVRGDTLWAIARHHGCTVAQVREHNGLAQGELRIGRRLKIPACTRRVRASGPRTYVVRRGDTLESIARRHHTTVGSLRSENGIEGDLIVVGKTLQIGGPPLPRVRVIPGQSVGKPHRGRLKRGIQLPRSPSYYRRRPKWAFGAQHVVDYTRQAITAVTRRYGGVHRLAIGDISRQAGGRIPGHRSHQSGRDIDLGLYFKRAPNGYPSEFVSAFTGSLHLAATWALVEALYSTVGQPGGVEMMFLDYRVQKLLYEHARGRGVSKSKLRKVLQYPSGRHGSHGVVRHEPNHHDHIHVRFGCPPGDGDCR